MSFPSNLDGAIVTFFNYGTGTVIDLAGGGKDNETGVIGYQFHTGKNQQWRLHVTDATDPNNLKWVIRNVASQTNLDLYQGGKENGTKITGWGGSEANTTNDHQLWHLVPAAAAQGYQVLKIQNAGTGTFVDLKDGNSANGTEIFGWADAGNNNQLWRVLRIE
ncbi:carbohydrate-binding module family 13 protein [Hypoxylon sp. CI-4A]|nr:carbohydrate-binding module family 13 protein [Hypoxylon sp. CI-4A]